MAACALAMEYVSMDVRFITMVVGVRTRVQHSVYRLVPKTDALTMVHVEKAVLQGTQEKDASTELTHSIPDDSKSASTAGIVAGSFFWWGGPNSCMWG
ncbi:hypothetical protein DPMN_058753 [Dreissena polymorpha]|uniref:Uncharacterized protein n=1 Tax=Dreissena polymorpha TaxID=45954 RepID=A0A9D4C2B7_DREPO|nr:hypothetical protein DPMN_058753 [Dreissena polymorpha]